MQLLKWGSIPLKNMGNNRRPSISISLSQDLFDEWVEEAEANGMNRSEYVRSMVAAGRRQIAELEATSDSSEQSPTRRAVLEALPHEEEQAVPAEEVIEEVVEPVREEVYDVLDREDQIRSSARYGGYYRQ